MTTTIQYDKIIKSVSRKAYDEVSAFIGIQLGGQQTFDEKGIYYILNRDGKQIIRMNQKEGKIEISNRVNAGVAESIEHIVQTEIREPDLVR